jgi:trans-aconitate methyltransferase
MAEQHDLRVVYKPVNIPIKVWIDTPSEEIRKLMKWPDNKKVLAVQVPNTFKESYTHYLTKNKNAMSLGQEDYKATIAALAAKYNKPARVILRQLASGKPLTLDYMTPLPYLDNSRGPLHEPHIVTKKGNK